VTRINSGIAVETLCDAHLLAEHREIVRTPNLIHKGKYNLANQPKEFTLGKGHVSFFYSRQQYLLDRYKELYNECKARGFNVTDYSSAWENLPKNLCNNYNPTPQAIALLQQRIQERLKGMKNVKITPKVLA
jgi:deoxyribonuclease (pyrimidine dimer)